MGPRTAPGLDLDQDLAFQELFWRIERVAGWGMLLLVVAACLGVFGSGPLSEGTAVAAGLEVRYPRFSSLQTSETLDVRIDGGAVRDNQARLWVDRRYLERVRLETVVPTPVRVEGTPDRVVYTFAATEPGHPLRVRLTLQPERIGVLNGALGVEPPGAGARLAFRQIVYP